MIKKNNYAIKYNRTLDKYDYINNISMEGGNSLVNKEFYIKKLKAIHKKIKKNGYILWYNSNGQLISNDNNIYHAEKKVMRLIKNENIHIWNNHKLIKICINFHFDDIFNEEKGALELDIHVNKIIINNEIINIQQYDTKASIMKLFYDYTELENFNIFDIKKIALIFIDNKIKNINPFKFYHYADIKEYLITNNSDSE